MSLRDRILSETTKLAQNPALSKLVQDERFMKLVMMALTMPGRISSFTEEQKETLIKTLDLATKEEVQRLERIIADLETRIEELERDR